MKRVTKIIGIILLTVLTCSLLTACGRATWHDGIWCRNIRFDIEFSAEVRAKYGSADPGGRNFECKKSIKELADIIREQNQHLVVEVSAEENAIYISAKTAENATYIKPSIAIIKRGENSYRQTDMTYISGLYLDYRTLQDYDDWLIDQSAGKKLKLAKGLTKDALLQKYTKWGYSYTESGENEYIVKDAKGIKSNIDGQYTVESSARYEYKFVFEIIGEDTYMTIGVAN